MNKIDKIDISQIGIYRMGLTTGEIKNYLGQLLDTKGKRKIEKAYKKFCKIAGINTASMVKSPCCGNTEILMYRWDVKRFAHQLLTGIPTYFD